MVKRIIFEDWRSSHMKSRIMTGGFLMICLGFCGRAWCPQEPAGEGQPITPAGTLESDATTHLPAVGPLPLTMLRSHQPLRHGGEARYLRGVNGGVDVRMSYGRRPAH